MALSLGKDGEMAIILRVKDDGSVVVEKFANNAEKAGEKASGSWTKIGKAAGLAAVAIAAAYAISIKTQIDLADATVKTADKLGLTAEALSGLRYHADLAGVSSENLNISLQMMTRNLADAARGGGEAQQAIRSLGLNAGALARMKPEEAVQAIASAMEKIPNQAQRVAIAMDIFGRSGGDMVNVMRGGAGAIKEGMAEAEKFGIIISTKTARQAELFNDNLSRMGALARGAANNMAAALLPTLIDLTDQFIEAYKAGGLLDAVIASIGSITGIDTAKKIRLLRDDIASLERDIKRLMESGSEDDLDDVRTIETLIERKRKELSGLEGAIKRREEALNRKSSPGGGAIANTEAERADLEKFQQSLRERLDALRASFSEEEKSRQQYNEQIHLINTLEWNNILTDEAQIAALREQAWTQHQANLGNSTAQGMLERQRLEQMTMFQQTQFYFGQLAQITAGASQHNKTMFQLNQLAGGANALISANVGATKALEWGWPLGPIFAGIIWAAAIANVNAIRNAKFGGGTSAPSIGAGAAVPTTPAADFSGGASTPPPPLPQPQIRRDFNITLVGTFSAAQLRDELAPLIADAVGDNVNFNVRMANG